MAIIGDIHANLTALQAVIDHLETQQVENIINVGDFVGYGPDPDEVVSCIRDLGAISIKGNYDIKVLSFPENAKKWSKKKRKEKYIAFQWAYQNLSHKNREYLGRLPREISLEIESWKILITHGSPASNEEHITTTTPDERLRELSHMTDAEIILCGHSHRPFARKSGKTWFINPGSIGRPDDGDPRSSYAVLQLAPGDLIVHQYRINYDLARTVEKIRKARLPEEFAEMLIQGYDLDTILNRQKNL